MEEDQIIKHRIEKQTFLRTEIIEKGYNPTFFQRYVEQLKEDGFLIIELKNDLKILNFRFQHRQLDY